MTVPIQVRRLPHAEGLSLPGYATAGAAGMDLLAAIAAPLAASTLTLSAGMAAEPPARSLTGAPERRTSPALRRPS